MTISRIAARCVRSGNIAMEEYPHYAYILDVLEEISETGEYIIAHQDLYPYVEKKISGGVNALKANLREYKTELERNASPDMIKEDANELKKMKDALGEVDKKQDPTAGAGMSMDEVINKLMGEAQNNAQSQSQPQPQPQPQPQQRPQEARPQSNPQPQPRPQGAQPQTPTPKPSADGVQG